MAKLTHFNKKGDPHMVDVGDKKTTHRCASAGAVISMRPETLSLIESGGHKKGDVIQIAQLAGIMAAKKTPDLIPLCHPLALNHVHVEITIQSDHLAISATCEIEGKTGVEMEALMATSVAALTVYDMCKSVDRAMVISDLRLIHKSGGVSGEFNAETPPDSQP